MKKQWLVILIVWVIGGTTVHAEMRVWTDKKGNSIEAEFVKIFSGKVVLKTAEGKQIKVPQNGLSQKDLEYLKNVVPPKIDIEVNIKKENKQTSSDGYGYSRRKEKIKGKVTLLKKNKAPSNRKFTAHLYVFAEDIRDDELWILDKAKHEFSFEHQKTVEFSGNQRSVSYSDSSYSNKYGDQYKGYLVFIEDDNGKIICIKGSPSNLEKNVGRIKKAKINDRFDDNLVPVNR